MWRLRRAVGGEQGEGGDQGDGEDERKREREKEKKIERSRYNPTYKKIRMEGLPRYLREREKE